MVYILLFIIVFACILIFFKPRKLIRKLFGCILLLGGMYLALLTGSTSSLILPGLGKIALGAGGGAVVGLGTSLLLGTLGVATGGVGVAVGLWGMTIIGGLLGGVGGTTSGFGFQTVTHPLVHWIYWLPLVLLGIYFLFGGKVNEKVNTHEKKEITNLEDSE